MSWKGHQYLRRSTEGIIELRPASGALDDNLFIGKTGEVVRELETRLSRGHYRFGDAINTNSLIDEFGASRAPVATALNYLRSQGYLIVTPQVGCEVVSPSQRDVEDFFVLFSSVESVVAEIATPRVSSEDLLALRQTIEVIKAATPKKGESLSERFLSGITEFHQIIRSAAGSSLVAQKSASYWRFHEFLLFNGKVNQLYRGLTNANKERMQIVSAMAAGEATSVGQLMKEHVLGKPIRAGIL